MPIMCNREERKGMVETLKRLGWVRSILTILTLILGLMISVRSIGLSVKTDLEDVIEEKIILHSIESESKIEQELSEIRTQQAITDTKVDILLERIPTND
jgi:hypothetical protein